MEKKSFHKYSILGILVSNLASPMVWANAEDKKNEVNKNAPLTVKASLIDPDDSRPKMYTSATKIPLNIKDIPQTIESIDVSKMKIYGINDLNVMLNGIGGVNTHYDMRGDGVSLRGFDASNGDIYRDGIRASGQIRRSTANVERIEVLKGPTSVLYGRGSGGGIINMISKQANFTSPSHINLRTGEWSNNGGTIDINQVIGQYIALRLTADREQAHSFRTHIRNKNTMVSPSIAINNQNGLQMLFQYTFDEVWRRPDRPPSYESLPMNVPKNVAYAHPDDFVKDTMHMWRSVIDYTFKNDLNIKWTNALHQANQDFDHLYNGKLNSHTQKLTFTRAWQETLNKTLTNMVDLTGKINTGSVSHEFLVGAEYTLEKRAPKLAANDKYPTGNPSYAIDAYYPNWSQPKTPKGKATIHNLHESITQAIYVNDLISVNQHWKLMAGLRYEHYKFSTHNKLSDKKRDYNGSSLSPRLGVIWQPTVNHSFYTSYSKNFSPYGGRGMISGVEVDQKKILDSKPQYSEQYEAGIKSDWFNSQLSSQLSVYHLEHYNIRYTEKSNPYVWLIKGKERSRGVELSLNGRLHAQWYIRSSLGYQESKIIENKQNRAQEGKHKANISKINGGLYLRYLPLPTIYVEAGSVFKSSFYNQNENLTQRPGYTLFNAAIGYRPKNFSLSLAVNNITNKEYWRSNNMPGTPRTFLVSANYVF